MKIDGSKSDLIFSAALEVADAAAVETLRWFRKPSLSANNKDREGYDPVTQADWAAEKVMRTVLASRRPQDAIIGEEQLDKPGTSGLSWILDPIDGTRGYISGTPTWGTLVAVNDGTSPILGIIDQPYIGERYVGGFGHSFMERDGLKIGLATRQIKALSQATVFTTYPEIGNKTEFQGFHQVADKCKLVRYGMDCYAYALLAAGHIDLVIEAGLKSYDIQAPIAIVRAAGGVASNWLGGEAMDGGNCLCSATPELHEAALEVLKPYASN